MIDVVFISVLLAAQAYAAFYLLLPVLINITAFLFPVSDNDLKEANQPVELTEDETGFACIITAYKNKDFALLLVDSLLRQEYENFHIWMVADRCEPGIEDPDDPRVTIIYPESPLDLKSKSIHLALQQIDPETRPFSIIFDADNLAHPRMLAEMNDFAKSGFNAIQCRRTAKNLDTAYACLDAAAEHYYHISQRLAPFKIGSSATIAGSGMAIKTELYSQVIGEMVTGENSVKQANAEDKPLQVRLVKEGYVIACAHNALLFDEKVARPEQMERQRTRWIGSWFSYFTEGLRLTGLGIVKGSWNAMLFGFIITSPPLFMLIAAVVVLLPAGYFLFPQSFIYFASAVVLFVMNVIASLLYAGAGKKIWKALVMVPFFILRQIASVLNLKKDNRQVLDTTHDSKLTIAEILTDKSLNLYRKP